MHWNMTDKEFEEWLVEEKERQRLKKEKSDELRQAGMKKMQEEI